MLKIILFAAVYALVVSCSPRSERTDSGQAPETIAYSGRFEIVNDSIAIVKPIFGDTKFKIIWKLDKVKNRYFIVQ